jgi:hypothetical protein
MRPHAVGFRVNFYICINTFETLNIMRYPTRFIFFSTGEGGGMGVFL